MRSRLDRLAGELAPWLLLALLAAALTACDLVSPSEPRGEGNHGLDTPWGHVVYDPTLDDEAVEREVYEGADRIIEQGYGGRLVIDPWLKIDAETRSCKYMTAAGMYPILEVGRSVSCIDHEMQHFMACWVLHRPHPCCQLQDHPGGYDLDCNRLPASASVGGGECGGGE